MRPTLAEVAFVRLYAGSNSVASARILTCLRFGTLLARNRSTGSKRDSWRPPLEGSGDSPRAHHPSNNVEMSQNRVPKLSAFSDL